MRKLAVVLLVAILCNGLLPCSAIAQRNIDSSVPSDIDRRNFEREMEIQQRQRYLETQRQIQARKEQAVLEAARNEEVTSKPQPQAAVSTQKDKYRIERIKQIIRKYGKEPIISLIQRHRAGLITVYNGHMEDFRGLVDEQYVTPESILEDVRKTGLSIDKFEQEVIALHKTQPFPTEVHAKNQSTPNKTQHYDVSRWELLQSDDNRAYYADPASISQNGNIVTIWVLIDYQDNHQIALNSYASSKLQWQIDCQARHIGELYHILHSGHMGTGSIVKSGYSSQRFEPIAPHTVGEELWKALCQSRSQLPTHEDYLKLKQEETKTTEQEGKSIAVYNSESQAGQRLPVSAEGQIDRAYRKVLQTETRQRKQTKETEVLLVVMLFCPLALAAVLIIKAQIEKTRKEQATEEKTLPFDTNAIQDKGLSSIKTINECISSKSNDSTTTVPTNHGISTRWLSFYTYVHLPFSIIVSFVLLGA